MAEYSYKTWQTINLPIVQGNTYFKILDHQIQTNPQNELTGVVYDGLIQDGFYIQNLQEILSRYMQPSPMQFDQTMQEFTGYEKAFYLYSTTNNWSSWTLDIINVEYDWSYEDHDRQVLSDPISNLLDVRQYLLYTIRPASYYNFESRIQNIPIDSFTLTNTNANYVYAKRLSDIDTYPGEFNYAYSYDFLVERRTLTPGTYETITVDNHEYIIAHTCYRYCVYYINKYGGWDSLLFAGKTMQSDNLKRLSYKQNYVAQSLDHNMINYATTVQETWQLNTSFVDDTQSEKMINLLASNLIYMHDLATDKIIPVNITNAKCDHKTYRNQNRRLYSYTVEVSASQPKFRI